jgi:glycosyltransferase involved in cell wall biosynthesis
MLLHGCRRHRVPGRNHGYGRDHCDHCHSLHEFKEGLTKLAADISVIIPAHNERSRIAPTIRNIARARTTDARVEFVVVDDASDDGSTEDLISAAPELLEEPRIDIQLEGLEEHTGIFGALNRGVEVATSDVLFFSDAHVEFSTGWDEAVLRQIEPDLILAGTTVESSTGNRGYGCHLLVPFMSTGWNLNPYEKPGPVQIATCSATALTRELFRRLGGYDTGMQIYGAGEPEFSVRAWLEGSEIRLLPELEVTHEFKSGDELNSFLQSIAPQWVHNSLRFGLLYLSEFGCLQLLRFYSRAYPEAFPEALQLIDHSDVWERRELLEERRARPFSWFVEQFGVRDQIGGEIM